MGVGFGYAISAGSRHNGFWLNVHLHCSRYDVQIADWEGCCRVCVVNCVGEFPESMGEFGSERLSKDYWLTIREIWIVETEFSIPQPFTDTGDFTLVACSTYLNPWIVLATVLDRPVRSGSRSKPNCHQFGDPGWQFTPTVNSRTVRWKSPTLSELGGMSAGCPAGTSIDCIRLLILQFDNSGSSKLCI